MFEYIKESIINSLVSEAGEADGRVKISQNKASQKVLSIERVGEYIADYIVGKKIEHTKGVSPVCGKEVITANTFISTPGEYQLSIRLKLSDQALGEFADANWAVPGRTILAGFTVPQSGSNKEAVALAGALSLAIPNHNTPFASVTRSGDTVTLQLLNPYLSVEKILLEKYDSVKGEYTEVPNSGIESTKSVEPFATAAWIQENLRFPSYENIRYASPAEDEYPIAGTLYDEYSFEYLSPRPGLHAGMGVGQPMQASTRHIMFVPQSLAYKFETKVKSGTSGITFTNESENPEMVAASTMKAKTTKE